MKITGLKVNHLVTPLGFEMENPVLSWIVSETKAKRQDSARVQLALDEEFEKVVYDSGRKTDIVSTAFSLPFKPEMETRYYWRVQVWSDAGETAVSEPTWFETAKSGQWLAEWISPKADKRIQLTVFHKFEVNRPVRRARIYMTGLGLYELYLNGEKQGEECLLPGFHDYRSWIQYQTFEVYPKQGENLIEIMLGDGWYKGNYGLDVINENYGDRLACIGELVLDYEDGTREVICTDENWKAHRSIVESSGIYCGEVQNALYDTSELFEMESADISKELLSPRLSPRILIHEQIKPVAVIETPAGEKVLDMGQNMVGWLSFYNRQPKGNTVTFQFGEILQDGNFFRDNLREAKAEFVYTSDGEEGMVRQHFTFYGFRYVKICGWKGELKKDDFLGLVIYSDMEEIGFLETSDPLVNQLVHNTKWGQKGNFLDIPTDCPQRDERMGWTGDAQIFCGTASYLTDSYAFYKKFGKDLYEEQKKLNGSVPFVVPTANYPGDGSTAWGDAATIIPWNIYLHSGDPEILERQYPSMKAWVDYMNRQDEENGDRGLWQNGAHFGDWLALDGKVKDGVYGATDPYFIASAYYFYSTEITAKAAKVLGYAADAEKYGALSEKIRKAFYAEYFTQSGRLAVDTMTAYTLVLYMNLFPKDAYETVCCGLKNKLMQNNYHLETGFVGTPYLCQALSANGMNELAYDLLMQRDYPGWLYEVLMGATTIWERWDSVLPDGKISSTGMNSLNHYSYGSIVEWMFKYMAGLQPVEEAPGFKKAVIAPMPDYHLRSMHAELMTAAGKYVSEWAILDEGERLSLKVEVPFDAEALLILPFSEESKTLTAGTWEFTYEPNERIRKRYSNESSLRELLENPETRHIIEDEVVKDKMIPFMEESTTLKALMNSPFLNIAPEKQEELNKKLRAL